MCQNAESLVYEETNVNFLEQIVGLFIRVQTHSCARDVKEKHKHIIMIHS